MSGRGALVVCRARAAVCLLWFMAAAMRNERLAARQKLAMLIASNFPSCRAPPTVLERIGGGIGQIRGGSFRTADGLRMRRVRLVDDDAIRRSPYPNAGLRVRKLPPRICPIPPPILSSTVGGALQDGKLDAISIASFAAREPFITHRRGHKPEQAHRRHEHGKQQEHHGPDITVLTSADDRSDELA